MRSKVSDDAIRHLVWSGFYREAEVLDLIGRLDTTDRAAEAAVAVAVRDEFARKMSEQATWPDVTDNDRLNDAFDELNRSGILSVQNAGQNQDDAFDNITQRYREQRDALPAYDGYCFYSGDDLGLAVDGDGLLLAFGDMKGQHDRATEIGRRIVAVLERHGLNTDWAGSYTQRIEIPGIIWQRRGP
ncbi:MAG: hypothetical protein EOP40_03085 [Rubrivivax sp.]|nr:MAG: hypothetical protein EOP40_03085 [Rubrivivax sp.]